jgi:hypothetical protein
MTTFENWSTIWSPLLTSYLSHTLVYLRMYYVGILTMAAVTRLRVSTLA